MKFENTQVWGFEHALRGMRNPKNSWHLGDTVEETYMNARGGYYFKEEDYNVCRYQGNDAVHVTIGPNDMKLALTLIKGGPEHRKFLRQIFVSVDITAPLYWWKEFDTYKVATVANSTSTMHKIQSFPITRESFEMDDYQGGLKVPVLTTTTQMVEGDLIYDHDDFIDNLISYLENLRLEYNAIVQALKSPQGDPDYVTELQDRANWVWKELIRWLPESWLQTRTVTFNYETIRAMCSPGQRRFHKLNEWSGKDVSNVPNFISWARTLPYAKEFIFTDEMPKPEKTPMQKIEEALAAIGVKCKEKGQYRLLGDVIEDIAEVFEDYIAVMQNNLPED